MNILIYDSFIIIPLVIKRTFYAYMDNILNIDNAFNLMEVEIIKDPDTDLDMEAKTYYGITLTDEDLEMLMIDKQLMYPSSELTKEMRTQFIFMISQYDSNKKFQLYHGDTSGNALYTEVFCDYRGLENFKDEIRSLGEIPIIDEYYNERIEEDVTLTLGYVKIKLE